MSKDIGKHQYPSALARISHSGFTLVETMVTMAILAAVGVGAVSVFYKLLDMQRVSDRWIDSDQTRSLVTAALSDSANCAVNLRDHAGTGLNPVTLATVDVDVHEIDQLGTRMVLKSQALSTLSNGVTYDLLLQLPAGGISSPPAPGFPAGIQRTTTTTRFLANLSLVATISGMSSKSTSDIPISMEFDTSGNLTSCTINPDDTEETLYQNQHSAQQCYAQGGTTFPTPLGVLCRFPMTQIQTGLAPTCPTVGGWTATPYESTITRDFTYQNCSGPQRVWVGWHHFSNNSTIESMTLTDIKKGTTNTTFNWQVWGGATGGGMVLLGVLGAFLGPFAILPIALGFIFSFTSCSSDPAYTVYAQALAIGCY